MRDFRLELRRAGPRAWLSAVAGLVAGFAEAAVLVLAVAVAVALSGGALATVDLPFHLSSREPKTLVFVGLGAALLRTLASLCGLWLSTTAKSAVEARYQRDLIRAYVEASWEAVAQRREGELQELTSAQALVAASSVMYATQAVQATLAFGVLVASTVLVDPAVAGASILGAGLLTLVLRPITRASTSRARRRLRHDLAVAALTAETVRLAEEIAVFGAGSVRAATSDGMIDERRKTAAIADFAAALTSVAYQGAVFILVFIGLGVLVAADVAVGPALGAIVVLLLRAFAYSQQAQSAYAAALAAVPRRDAVLSATTSLANAKPRSGDLPLTTIDTCELIGVSYSYPPDHRALTAVDLKVDQGEAVGIVGPSGAGKSTLVQVLLRLRAPSEGRYLVNDRPASDYRADDWSGRVSLVPQEPKLIEGTIADNIRFLRDEITDEQVAHASVLAGLEADLQGLVGGLGRSVGGRDRALSVGQRQRLAIARSLAGEPSLLVLDEPTSALDAECERVIQETLVSLKGTVTVLVITHRPTTLESCDRVVVMRDGRIEADGSPGQAVG